MTARSQFYRVLILATVLLAAGACAPVGPEFVKPEADLPGLWTQAAAEGFDDAASPAEDWWTVFQDPILNELVETARRNNNNLEIAALRVLEARAQLGIATGLKYPQTQAASGDATYISPPNSSAVSDNYWQFGLGAGASWEIDFWGRFRRAVESADAAYLASIAAYDQATIILTAAVVDVYASIRSTEEQLRYAKENLVIQQRSYDITEVLYRNGSDSELDMQQALTLLLSTEATIPDLESILARSRNALGVLLGQPPGTVESLLSGGSGIPAIPETITIGVPADLLRRRPDVRQAEYTAMARNAQVGLAEADLYPSFSLSGAIGVSSNTIGEADFGDLFSADALTWSIGPSFVWPFLNYGRIRNNVRVQDARLQQALVNYREIALQAAREAEDAMARFIGARKKDGILGQTVASAQRSNELSTLRYSEGYSGYERVLDAQQALFTQQQRYIANRGEIVSSLAALYKALGGGWDGNLTTPALAPQTRQTLETRTNWGDLIDATFGEAGASATGNGTQP
jgi:NodT family efflux transporter outer membrane factor (OMF) lipoprotein